VGPGNSHGCGRALKTKVNVSGVRLQQVGYFDSPERDPRGRIAAVVYLGKIDYKKFKQMCGKKLNADDTTFLLTDLPKLGFDHLEIIKSLQL
jgi:ADP-ribose pyrophosphatase YjhB (NUDIX family)